MPVDILNGIPGRKGVPHIVQFPPSPAQIGSDPREIAVRIPAAGAVSAVGLQIL